MDFEISKLLSEVNRKLEDADNYLRSSENPVFLGHALLNMHGALEDYFRASIIYLQPEKKSDALNKKITDWPVLLDFAKQYLGFSEEEASNIRKANTHRNRVAHAEGWDWNYHDLILYFSLVKKWCSKDLGLNSTNRNNFNNVRQIQENYQKPKEPNSNEQKSTKRPNQPKQSSNLPLGCMWFLFLFLTPIWAIIIIFDKNGTGLLKFIGVIYLLVLISMVCFMSSSGLISLSEITKQIESSGWETLTDPFQEILADERSLNTSTPTPKIIKTPYCEIIWENYQGEELKNKNRFNVWDEIISKEIQGSDLTYQEYLKQVLEYNPRLIDEGYVFNGTAKYKLPKCK